MSELIREQQDYIDSQMTRLWNRNIKNRDGEIIIPIAWFEELSQFEKKEMLRRSIKGVKRNLREIEYKHIQLSLRCLKGRTHMGTAITGKHQGGEAVSIPNH